MRVRREEINKLKQQERIEFYTKANHIHLIFLSQIILGLSIIIISFIGLVGAIIMKKLLIVIFYFIIYIIFIFLMYLCKKQQDKSFENLENEYFEVKPCQQ